MTTDEFWISESIARAQREPPVAEDARVEDTAEDSEVLRETMANANSALGVLLDAMTKAHPKLVLSQQDRELLRGIVENRLIDLQVRPVEEFESTTEWWTQQASIIKRRTTNQKQLNQFSDRTYELRRLIDN